MRRRCLGSLTFAVACTEVRDPPSTDHFSTSSSTDGGATSTSDEGSSSDPPPADVAQSPSLAACQAHCARRRECGSTIDPFLCEQACIDELLTEIDLVGCTEAHVALLECAATLDCADLVEPADHGCADQAAAQQTACDTTCGLSSSATDPTDAVCEATFTCGLTERTLRCEGEMCTCAVAGETVATCSTEPDCPMQVALIGASWWASTASQCCGWDSG